MSKKNAFYFVLILLTTASVTFGLISCGTSDGNGIGGKIFTIKGSPS